MASGLLLAADIGNTHITLGAFDGRHLLSQWRLATAPEKTADEYGGEIQALVGGALPGRTVRGFIYGSVVPRLDQAFETLARRYFGVKPASVTPKSPLGLKLKVRRPEEVGADRLLNALAAWRLYGAPALVVDFGTATTLDCLSSKGEYLGGAILIGPGTAARALAEKTAKLPQVEPAPVRRFIGKDTVECLQAGLYHGYLGMVERVLAGTLREMRATGGKGKVRLIATGGWAGLFARKLGITRVAMDLTLQGLRLAHEIIS